jgi:hypothetical protein
MIRRWRETPLPAPIGNAVRSTESNRENSDEFFHQLVRIKIGSIIFRYPKQGTICLSQECHEPLCDIRNRPAAFLSADWRYTFVKLCNAIVVPVMVTGR